MAKKMIGRNILAGMLGILMRASGKTRRARKSALSKNLITPIYFHNPSRKLFEKCVKWLLNAGYTFISTKELISILYGKAKPKPGSVWMTFDDGWKSNMTNVIPVVKKYKLPVTFFITTGPVKNSGIFRWSYAELYADSLSKPPENGASLLREMDEPERKKIIAGLEAKYSKTIPRQAMTVDDIRAISKIDTVEIGNHTANHTSTTECTDEDLRTEVIDSIENLRKWTGKPVISFSYPNGDFLGSEKTLLEKCGIKLAATTAQALVSPDTDPYFVPRLCVGINDGFLSEAICHMLGIWNPASKKFKRQ